VQPGLFTIGAADGRRAIRLTTTPAGVQETPGDFSPDGHRVVLIRTSPGTEETALFTVHTDGTQLKQLTPYGAQLGHEFADARWSSDGREILFASPQGELLLASPDRPGLTTIELAVHGPHFAFAPAWSPNGTKIVFSMSLDGQEDVYTANRDGSDVTQVTATPDFEPFADWGK
jgi:Tol biopolymer transport system component